MRVAIRRNNRARRIALRIDPAKEVPELVLPPRTSESEGLDFVRSRADWLLKRLAALPPHIPFCDGTMLPFLGHLHKIVHDSAARRGVWLEGDCIVVSGHIEHLSRRVHDWLRREAKTIVTPRAHDMAAILKRKPGNITVRNQKSRWGSCSSSGNLSFNWRLVLAPDPVLDYVVAHEVGHMAEPNHSPAFWKIVDQLSPHAQQGRDWLRKNGDRLFRYG